MSDPAEVAGATAGRKRRRVRVLEGRPKPLNWSSAILLDVDAVLRLDGRSIKATYVEAGYESMFKGMERVIRLGLQQMPPKLGRQFADIVRGARLGPVVTLCMRALQGDQAAAVGLREHGLWAIAHESLTFGKPGDAISEHRWMQHLVEVERACRPVDALLSVQDFRAAADALASSNELAAYLSAEALSSLSSATEDVGALPGRVAGAFEVLLANVARMDLESRRERGTDESFEWLLEPVPRDDRCRPGREFSRRLVQELAAGSFDRLLTLAQDREKQDRQVVDISTLSRWASGAVFPREEKVRELLTTMARAKHPLLQIEALGSSYGYRYKAARRLHKMLEMLALVDTMKMPDQRPVNVAGLLGHGSPAAWARTRYRYWLRHWEQRGLVAGMF